MQIASSRSASSIPLKNSTEYLCWVCLHFVVENHDLALHVLPNIPWYELYFVEGPSWDRQIKVYKMLARVLRVNTYPDEYAT